MDITTDKKKRDKLRTREGNNASELDSLRSVFANSQLSCGHSYHRILRSTCVAATSRPSVSSCATNRTQSHATNAPHSFDLLKGTGTSLKRYLLAAWRASHLALAASSSSIAISLVTPSIVFWTSSTSEKPIRCLLEMSHLPPTAALCSPELPRGCRSKPSQISSSFFTSLLSSGNLTITLALSPVPKLEGQVPRNPSLSSYMSFLPLFSAAPLIAFDRWQNLSNTPLRSPPFSIAMMRHWSSSLHQHSTVLESLWKIPLPSGQSRAAPAAPSNCAGPGF
mmetsp:Transcript_8243/g.13062  ORF Transcript_8243/g.13062 Transcript_8243/m.13062 type:complete len:280 (+) Transcript_8243:86-925(+)